MPTAPGFDVFLSHNSDDKDAVRRIAERLRDSGIRPWFDEWCLVPGTPWQKGLAEGLRASGSTALFVGSKGVGPWQNAESMLVLDRAFADDSYRVIPVLLPVHADSPPPALPPFSNLFTWVDFRRSLEDDRALDRLIAGIKGAPPTPSSPPGSAAADGKQVELLSEDELARCLRAIGVADAAVPVTAEAIRREIAMRLAAQDSRAVSSDQSPLLPDARVRHRVDAFRRHLLAFLQPERLVADSFYLSTQKINRMIRTYSDSIPLDRTVDASPNDSPERRFLRLHQYMSAKRRLVFAPARTLLGQELPHDGETWVYYTGSFVLRLDSSVLDQISEARGVIESSNRSNLYNIVSRLFASPDPFYFPIVEFEGSLGPSHTTLVASRKHIVIESHSATGLAQALIGDAVWLSGFGTLNATGPEASELQAIACRMSLVGTDMAGEPC
jgi:hypothetical protein